MIGSLLVIISDTHIGGSTAISTPTYTIHNRHDLEEQVVQANRLQSWLIECWNDFWQYVYHLQGKGKKARRLIVIHCGDCLEGVHHSSTQLMPEIDDQMKMALELLEPIRNKCHGFYGIFGTPTHSGIDNADESAIYNALNVDAMGYQLTLDVDGVIHDFAHHGRAGKRPWTSAEAGIAAEVCIDYAQRGQRPPDYIWRGHNHIIDDSGLKLPATRAISLPSWQLKTSFGWRVGSQIIRSDIGGMIVVDGLLDDSKSRYRGQADERQVIKA